MTTKDHPKRAFVVMKLSDDLKEIVVESCSEEECGSPRGFDELMATMPPEDGRYLVYDYPYTSKAGAQTSKLIMIMWCPSCMAIKKKMLYASSKSAVKSKLNSEVVEIQFDCMEDVCHDDILQKLKK
ncbi:hypothetical protein ACOMHN_023254 [Nucella lapillus]